MTPEQIFEAHGLTRALDIYDEPEQRVLAHHLHVELDGKPPEELILSTMSAETAEAMQSGERAYSPRLTHHVVSFADASGPEGEIIWRDDHYIERITQLPDALFTLLPPDAQGRQVFIMRDDTTPFGYNPEHGGVDNMLWDRPGEATRFMLVPIQDRFELIRVESSSEWYYEKSTQVTSLLPDDAGYWRAQPDRVWTAEQFEALTLSAFGRTQATDADVLHIMRLHAQSASMPASEKVGRAFLGRYARTEDVKQRMDLLLTTPLLGADAMAQVCEPLLSSSEATTLERDACMNALLDVVDDPRASSLVQAHLSDTLTRHHTDTSRDVLTRDKFLVTKASLRLPADVFRAHWEAALRGAAASNAHITHQIIAPSWDELDDNKALFDTISITPHEHYETLYRTTLTLLREALERRAPDEQAYTDILVAYAWDLMANQAFSPSSRDALRELLPRSLALSRATSRFSSKWHTAQPLYMAAAYPQELGTWSKVYLASAPSDRGEVLMFLKLQAPDIELEHDMILDYLRRSLEADPDFIQTSRMFFGVELLARHEPAGQALHALLTSQPVTSEQSVFQVMGNALFTACKAGNETLVKLFGAPPEFIPYVVRSTLNSGFNTENWTVVWDVLFELDLMPSNDVLMDIVQSGNTSSMAQAYLVESMVRHHPAQALAFIARMSSEAHIAFARLVYRTGQELPGASVLRLQAAVSLPSSQDDYDPCDTRLQAQVLLHLTGHATLDQLLQTTSSPACKSRRDEGKMPDDDVLAQYIILEQMGYEPPTSDTWRAQIEQLARHPHSTMRHRAQQTLALLPAKAPAATR